MPDQSLNRREMLRRCGGAAALAVTAGRLRAATKRPNLLFLFADDQRFNTLGALGNHEVQTPNLDRLVNQGTAFTHCCIQGSTSGAVCICSRAQLLTGRSLYRAPTTPRESDGLTFWPQAFRQAGYRTFGTGKWHNGPWSFAQSFTDGAAIFFGGMSNHLQVPIADFDPTGEYPRQKRYTGGKFSSELFSDAAVEFLKDDDDDAPFFAYVSYTAPHDPRIAPEAFKAMYPPERISVPPNFLPEHPFDNGELKIRDEQLGPWPRTPEIVREHLAAYYAMITHLDLHLGRVLEALEQSGRAKDTLVVFAADNGLALGSHGLLGKQNLYEESVRVPLVISGPGIQAGRRIDDLVYLHDLYPTTCDLIGLPTPETVESRSLAPLLRGSSKPVHDVIFAGYKNVQRMVRDSRWKLIRYPEVEVTQLFDLDADPFEQTNLAGDPKYAGQLKRLAALLRAQQQVVGDELDLDRVPRRPGDGRPAEPRADGSYELRPEHAKLTGALCFQPDKDNVGCWTNPKDFLTFALRGVKPGRYWCILSYGSANPHVALKLGAGQQTIEGTTINTGGMRAYGEAVVGALALPAGDGKLTLRAGEFKGAVMNFHRLWLWPMR